MTGARSTPAPNIIVEEEESEEREYGATHTAPLLHMINIYFKKKEREGEREIIFVYVVDYYYY